MPESVFIVVRLDTSAPENRLSLVDDIVEWLLAEQVITGSADNHGSLAEFGLGVWSPGRRWRSVLSEPPTGQVEHSLQMAVDISATLQPHSRFGQSTAWTCRRCGSALDSSESADLVDAWLLDGEPNVVCAACGSTALLGDWPAQQPAALVGAPSVTFHNWPQLERRFIADLEDLLGGRCRHFWQHP